MCRAALVCVACDDTHRKPLKSLAPRYRHRSWTRAGPEPAEQVRRPPITRGVGFNFAISAIFMADAIAGCEWTWMCSLVCFCALIARPDLYFHLFCVCSTTDRLFADSSPIRFSSKLIPVPCCLATCTNAEPDRPMRQREQTLNSAISIFGLHLSQQCFLAICGRLRR